MTLTKNKIVREIGQRTRLKNRDIQEIIETLFDVWTESLVAGDRIEVENLFVLETKTIDRGVHCGVLSSSGGTYPPPRFIRRLTLRASKRLKSLLRDDNVK